MQFLEKFQTCMSSLVKTESFAEILSLIFFLFGIQYLGIVMTRFLLPSLRRFFYFFIFEDIPMFLFLYLTIFQVKRV